MYSKLLLLSLILFFVFGFSSVALTASKSGFRLDDAAQGMGFKDNTNYSDVPTIINLAVNLTLSLLAIIFFGMMMYAGIRWITAQGEDDKIEKAKTAIRAAIIGMVLVVGSYGISRFVFNALGFSGGGGATVDCSTAKDGATCAYNKVCSKKTCTSKCEVQYPSAGICMDENACKLTGGSVTKNLCPGGNSNICCH